MTPAERMITRYLDPGERLLWSDQPRPGIRFGPGDALRLSGALLALAAATFFLVSHPVDRVFLLTQGVTILLALIEFRRLPHQIEMRSNTYYGISTQRVLIVRNFPRDVFESFSLDELGSTDLKTRHDRSGTITFSSHKTSKATRRGIYGGPEHISFDFIENAQGVYDILQAARLSLLHAGNSPAHAR